MIFNAEPAEPHVRVARRASSETDYDRNAYYTRVRLLPELSAAPFFCSVLQLSRS